MTTSQPVGVVSRCAYAAARAAGRLSRLSGRGRGGTIPGRVALALRPRALSELTAGRTVVLVSGTNGKSTTTRLLAAALAWQGGVVTNGDGANLVPGLVAALLDPRRTSSATIVLEVDERALPSAMDAANPGVVVLLNLSRDQLDRFEEVGSHVDRWTAALGRHPGVRVVGNAADPLIVGAVQGARPGNELVTWVDAGSPWRSDAPLCFACGNAWDLSRVPWACDACGAHRPAPQWLLEGAGSLVDAAGSMTPLQLTLRGRAAGANAVMAVAAAHVMGVPVDAAVAELASVTDVDGRYLSLVIGGRSVQLLLAKNPAGWLEILDSMDGDDAALVLGINARTADGTDPSWLWDVPFERLAGRRVTAFGDRALDLSVRLHYAGVDHSLASDVLDALRDAEGPVQVAANYTAFVGARHALQLAAQ
ncbi:MAG: MurT ligase domain-containing protein [Mycobacteriales bacterium]